VSKSEKAALKDSLSAANVFVGFSLLCSNLSNLRAAWRQAEIAALTRFFDQSSRVFEYAEPVMPVDRASFDQQVQKIALLLGTGDSNGLSACVKEFFAQVQDLAERARMLYMFHDFMITGVIRKYWELTESDMYLNLKSIMIENIHQFESFEDYQRTVLDFLIYLDSRFKKERTEYPFIAEAIEYIHVHFRENLNMTVVANHVSVNYTYFSEKFKEHTGVNFNDYLKALRIDEAKQLLEKGCYKVYEVAANSGFGDAKYFMKTFKEITGLSPGEYRKKF
jgi:two-component system, response regulator YesN